MRGGWGSFNAEMSDRKADLQHRGRDDEDFHNEPADQASKRERESRWQV